MRRDCEFVILLCIPSFENKYKNKICLYVQIIYIIELLNSRTLTQFNGQLITNIIHELQHNLMINSILPLYN